MVRVDIAHPIIQLPGILETWLIKRRASVCGAEGIEPLISCDTAFSTQRQLNAGCTYSRGIPHRLVFLLGVVGIPRPTGVA